MSDILVAVPDLFAGHSNEKPVVTIHDLDVVNDEDIVECDRCNGLHAAAFGHHADPDIRNFQTVHQPF